MARNLPRRVGLPGLAATLGVAATVLGHGIAHADESPGPVETFALHVQSTFIDQGHDAFASPYQGANSLSPKAEGRETFNFTLFIGARPWRGAEIWVNPEIDQGFGLSNTLGIAGFPNGQGAKIGKAVPYFRLQRLFLRQTVNLSGGVSKVDPDLNQLGGERGADRLVFTVGKLNVTDVFDTNAYAHDPTHDFLNWALIDTGTFDYAADAWGYTVGAAAEWYQGAWTWRAGVFDLSDVPNSTRLDSHFGQFQLEAEIERRYRIGTRDGSVKFTGFLTRGRQGRYDDAVALALASDEPANIAAVRRYRRRTGLSFNLQQQISDDLGAFIRAGVAGGSVEPYEYADIDRTAAAGLSLSGRKWGLARDTVGLAGIVNGISTAHERYLQFGGLGILIGDGRLPHPGPEEIAETYYDHALGRYLHLALDYQFVNHPAYNRDRGPVSIVAARLHFQF